MRGETGRGGSVTALDDRLARGTPAFRRAAVGLFLAGFSGFALLYITQPLLPALSDEFDLSPTAASLSVSVTTAALALAVLPLSFVSERFGRLPVMITGLLAAGLLAVLCAFAPSFGVLLVLRALQGVALATTSAVAMAYLAEETHPGSLGFAVGLHIAGNGLGGCGGRLIAGAVADVADWRWAVGVVGATSLVCAIAFAVVIPRSRRFRPTILRPRSMAAALAGHLRDSTLRWVYAVGFLVMAAFVTVYNYLGYRLLDPPFGLSQAVVGLVFVLYLVGSLTSALAGRLADRMGPRGALWVAFGVTVGGLVLTVPDWLPTVLIGVGVFTGGFFAVHSVASSTVGRRAASARAQASALYLLAYYTGSSVGGTVGGLAFEAGGWAANAGYALALLAVVAVAITRIPARPTPARAASGSRPAAAAERAYDPPQA